MQIYCRISKIYQRKFENNDEGMATVWCVCHFIHVIGCMDIVVSLYFVCSTRPVGIRVRCDTHIIIMLAIKRERERDKKNCAPQMHMIIYCMRWYVCLSHVAATIAHLFTSTIRQTLFGASYYVNGINALLLHT